MPTFPSDLEIAQQATLSPIQDIAEKLGLSQEQYDPYGRYIAKLQRGLIDQYHARPDGKLVLVTAITPTPAGEGKSTTTVGLGDALNCMGKKVVIAIREPSLGPCFGTKGGATGGGYAQVMPMEDINLHFTGDFHAITSAHNLLAAMVANHVHQGNARRIDVRKVQWKHVLDLNARHLREIIVALGGSANGFPMESGFDITTASEVMAILCLSKDVKDLKARLGNIYIGQDLDGNFLYARDVDAVGAMAVLLKEAIRPNLVQTLEKTPALIHGGPFGNIAHGCNSLIATKLALKLGEFVVTEAGFGSDLGAEKFLDIKCRQGDLRPDAVVMVATIRALRCHGGVGPKEYATPNPEAVKRGLANLGRHIRNIQSYGLPLVVGLNAFLTDTPEEQHLVQEFCHSLGVEFAPSEVWEHGGEGGVALAEKVLGLMEKGKNSFHFQYELDRSLEEKVETIAKNIYGAGEVVFSSQARTKLAAFAKNGFGHLPVCMAKTHSSLTADPKIIGAPEGFSLPVVDARLSAGAGFVVVFCGEIMTMPGLGKEPAAVHMDLTEGGRVLGLF